MNRLNDYVASRISPSLATVANLRRGTWAICFLLACSVALAGSCAVRGYVTFRECSKLKRLSQADDRSIRDLETKISETARAVSMQKVECGWLDGPTDLAARLENGGKSCGVKVVSFVPKATETEESPAAGPSPETRVKSQDVEVKAYGGYSDTLRWVRWLSSPSMPVRIKSMTLYPRGNSKGPSLLGVDINLTLFSPVAKETG